MLATTRCGVVLRTDKTLDTWKFDDCILKWPIGFRGEI